MGGLSMDNTTTTTTQKIGKITYIVTASPSEKATDTLTQKIEKLIIKNMRQNANSSDILAQ
jgi:hypothetical protein